MGLLLLCFKQVMAVLMRRKKPMVAYGQIMEQAGRLLTNRYGQSDSGYSKEANGKHSRYVWVCWLQGMEKAPKLVQVCYQSV